ncbi:hypothetical protein [Aurantimonas sp. VKM B-3413]|uniref:hypothetical protein n=1 Tax=Aurantimonas sp. VKM B-3413 TaxID=2779401 RepID=UPI001E47D4D6|nr:hypothetical protein [Aurantimonas sp. VKM B-3413]MCB8838712.1 hypothetical protein [Aurantimonas sp. VKM B-3413]
MIRKVCTAALLAGAAALPATAAGPAGAGLGSDTGLEGPLHEVVEGTAMPMGASVPSATDFRTRSQPGVGQAEVISPQAEDGAGPGAARGLAMTVKELEGFRIVGENGDSFGHAEEVVSVKGDLYAVVEFGTFSFLPTKPIAIPLSALAVSDGVLIARGISEEQIEGLKEFDDSKYAKLDDAQAVTIALP